MSTNDDDATYPDEHTRRVVQWCEEVDSVLKGDDETLPRLVKKTETQTLMGVFGHFEEVFADNEKLGDDEAPVDAWDHEVREGVRQELISRGLKPVPSELAPFVDQFLANSKPDKLN